MNRRQLLKWLALELGTLMPGLGFSEDSNDYDLIVVGSGAAALSAAVAAYDQGLKKILVIEKEPIIGGSSAVSGGALAVSETQFQRSHGVIDTDQRFYDDIMKEQGLRMKLFVN